MYFAPYNFDSYEANIIPDNCYFFFFISPFILFYKDVLSSFLILVICAINYVSFEIRIYFNRYLIGNYTYMLLFKYYRFEELILNY